MVGSKLSKFSYYWRDKTAIHEPAQVSEVSYICPYCVGMSEFIIVHEGPLVPKFC